MSDDEVLGTTCFIPRRTYLAVLAIFIALYGVFNTLYYALLFYTSTFEMHPERPPCVGHRCHDTLNCDATRRSSFNLRISLMTIGSLVFGVRGFNAIVNKYDYEMFAFGCWLAFLSALLLIVLIFDNVYYYACDEYYSYNAMAETLLFPIKRIPVNSGIKYMVSVLESYPGVYIDNEAGFHVLRWYNIVQGLKIAFFAHFAQTAFILADRFHYGIACMGATFSIDGWRRRLLLKQDMEESYSSAEIIPLMIGSMESQMGLIDADDFEPARRPYNGGLGSTGMARQWYQGRMKDPRAYDGFKDDRANVLL